MNDEIKLPLFGLKAMWPFARKYKAMVIRMLVLGILVSSVDAAWALITRYSVHHIVGENSLRTLPHLVIFTVSLITAQVLVCYVNVRDCSRLELYLNRDMRNTAFSHLQKMSLSYYNTNSVGYIHARVMSDAGKIGDLMAWRLMNLVWFGSYIIFAVIIMFCVDVRLAAIVTAVLITASCVTALFQKKLIEDNRQVREVNSIITGDINEGITGARSIKNLVCENVMSDRFRSNTLDMKRKSIRTAHHGALFGSTVSLMTCVSLALVFYKGGQMNAENAMKIGVLSVFMSYALGLMEPVRWVVDDLQVLGHVMTGRDMRDWYVKHPGAPAVGYLRSVGRIPTDGQVRRLTIAGEAGSDYLKHLEKNGYPEKMPESIIFLSPPFPPSRIPEELRRRSAVTVVIGEFAARYSREYLAQRPDVRIVSNVELYIPDWMDYVIGPPG